MSDIGTEICDFWVYPMIDYNLFSLNGNLATLVEKGFYAQMPKLPTRCGAWQFYLRSPPSESLSAQQLAVCPLIAAIYTYTNLNHKYMFMSRPGTVKDTEVGFTEFVHNATVLTTEVIETSHVKRKIMELIAVLAMPIAGAAVGVGAWYIKNLIDPSQYSQIPAAGLLGAFGGAITFIAAHRHILMPFLKSNAATVIAQLLNPADYVYGRNAVGWLDKASKNILKAEAEGGRYKSISDSILGAFRGSWPANQ